jgi:hypothetical protein
MDYLQGHGCEFIVAPNDRTGECVTFPRMLRELASDDPNEISFYGHAKGVKYEPQLPPPVRRWAEVQYQSTLDDWLAVRRDLERFAVTGPIKRMGRYVNHQRLGDWHYCGTFFWLRHQAVFPRVGTDVPDFYGGVEAWPGIHFRDHEAGCLFMNAGRQAPYLESFWRSRGDRARASWKARRGSVPVPPDLATPVPLDDQVCPRTEQKPRELAWWIGLLLQHRVRSLLVIGCAHGGVEWHVARVLRAHGHDIALTSLEAHPGAELQSSLEHIRTVFRQEARLVAADSGAAAVAAMLAPGYDAVFIDGDHGYRAVHGDWLLAQRLRPRLVGLHDIVDSDWHAQNRCCVSRLWREISVAHATEERAGADWGGIGVVKLADGH